MRLVLNGSASLAGVVGILEKHANQYLKVRKGATGKAKVTGEEVETSGSRSVFNIRLPLDTRYQQDLDALDKFNSAWSKEVHNRYNINSGHMNPIL